MTTPHAKTDVAKRDEPRPAPLIPLAGPVADLDSAYRYASALAQADIMPKDLRGKPSNVLAIILYGQQLDLTPMQAIQSIYVVNGRPSMSGQLWLSKVREAGHSPKIEHGDGACTVTITRGDNGESHTETFTIDDAKRAGLASKDIWKNYPKRMLMWRAVSDCATVICPEVALGFGLEGDAEPEHRPSLAQVAAERADRPATTQAVDSDEATRAEILAIEAQHQGPEAGVVVEAEQVTEPSDADRWQEVLDIEAAEAKA